VFVHRLLITLMSALSTKAASIAPVMLDVVLDMFGSCWEKMSVWMLRSIAKQLERVSDMYKAEVSVDCTLSICVRFFKWQRTKL